ncbi:MAG TPA: hypothetical protein VEB21_19690 [Terriglobales bacterium]|nr:hypothetical protein [Terriglobales bacterium]
MKRLPSLLIAALLLGLAAAPAAGTEAGAPIDAINGFRDAKFGTPFRAFNGLEEVEAVGPDKVCYLRRGDDLDIGDGGRLMSIKYCFYHKRLWAVVLDAAGPHNTEALRRMLEATYGPGSTLGTPAAGGGRSYAWRGQTARGYFEQGANGIAAQARLWSSAAEAAGAQPGLDEKTPLGHARHDPRRPVQRGVPDLRLEAPLHARPGLTVQISLKYRNLTGPGRLRIKLPRLMRTVQTVPEAHVGADEVVLWGELQAKNGSVKLKAQIDANAPPGRALLIRADLDDGAGNHLETRETIVLH